MAERRYALINKTGSTDITHTTQTDQKIENGDYTFVGSDSGKLLSKQSGGAGETWTIPPATVPTAVSFDTDAFDTDAFDIVSFLFSDSPTTAVEFPVGSLIAIDNSGGDDLSIVITSDTLIWARNNLTGPRVIADGGLAVIMKVDTTVWKIAGEGVT